VCAGFEGQGPEHCRIRAVERFPEATAEDNVQFAQTSKPASPEYLPPVAAAGEERGLNRLILLTPRACSATQVLSSLEELFLRARVGGFSRPSRRHIPHPRPDHPVLGRFYELGEVNGNAAGATASRAAALMIVLPR
jgi:hypothetical protein